MLEGHKGEVYCVTMGEVRGKIVVASGSADDTVILWDLATRKLLGVLRGHSHDVCGVAMGAAGGRALVVSGSEDKTVQQHNLRK